MKHLNFLSSLGSQSGSHRVVTKAVTVGSPSVHRRGNLLKPLFLAMLFLIAGVGNLWATEEVYYTLTPAGGSNNSYAGNCDIEIDDITWNLEGNSQVQPWKLGANSSTALSNTNKSIYSKTAIDENITKIIITHGSTSNITVNSMTVTVSTAANGGGTVISSLTPTFVANNTVTVTRPQNADWTGRYYKITYNLTGSKSKANSIQFSGAEFYYEAGGSGDPTACADPEFSLAAGSYEGAQSVEITCSTDDATIYYTTDGSDPTTSSAVYSTAIPVTANTTIKAYAVKADLDDSQIVEAAYTITAGPDVTLDFTSNDGWDFPTSSKVVTETSYTKGDYTIKVAGSEGQGFLYQTNDNNLMVGKNGAYLTLPTFDRPITKIVVVGFANGSGSVGFNVYQGETAVSTAVTSCKVDQTFEIAEAKQKADVAHSIKITTTDNIRFSKIKIYLGAAPEKYAVTLAADGGTLTATKGGNAFASGTEVVAGTELVMTATPDETHTTPSSIVVTKTVGGDDVTSTVYDSENNKITVPEYAITVSASFVPTYAIVADANITGGSVSWTDGTTTKVARVIAGTHITPSAEADNSHENPVLDIYKTGELTTKVSLESGKDYFLMPAYDVTISATFDEKQDPSITVKNNVTSLTFGPVADNASCDAQTFVISGLNLEAGKLTIASNSDKFVVSSTSLDENGQMDVDGTLSETTITVTPVIGDAGVYNGKVIISGGGIENNVEISLTLTVQQTYTAKWYVNGAEQTASTVTVVEGTALTFPDAPTPTGDCLGLEFKGWLTAPLAQASENEPAYLITTYTGHTMSTEDVNYYAVFAEASTGTKTEGVLDESEISSHYATASHKYTDDAVSYVDGNFTWYAVYNVDAANRPWMQFNNTAYLQITAPKKISKVVAIVTSSSNQSGGITDKTKYNPFSSACTLSLKAGSTSGAVVGSASTNTTDSYQEIAIDVTSGDNTSLYLMASAAYRLWGVTVTCEDATTYTNYVTTCAACSKVTFVKAGEDANNTFALKVNDVEVELVKTCDAGASVTVEAKTLAEGYELSSVAISALEGVTYNDGVITIAKDANGELTVTATFSQKNYSISVVSDPASIGATLDGTTTTAKYNVEQTISTTEPTGYLFGGWFMFDASTFDAENIDWDTDLSEEIFTGTYEGEDLELEASFLMPDKNLAAVAYFDKIYSVSEFDALSKEDGTKYVIEGLICNVESYSNDKYLTYHISDNGVNSGTTLKIYKGLGLNGASFSAATDLKVGERVRVYGAWDNSHTDINQDNKLLYHQTLTVSSVAIGGSAEKTAYSPSDNTFSFDGLTATATYNTGYVKDVTGEATWTANSENPYTVAATDDVTVRATFGGQYDEETIGVTYTTKTVKSIYLEYESTYTFKGYDLPKPKVYAKYVESIADDEITSLVEAANGYDTESAYNKNTPGNYTINVGYESFNAEYTVQVRKIFDNEDAPHNVADAIALIVASAYQSTTSSTDYMWVRGKVSSQTQYNSSYYISDDGTTTGQLYVYSGKYFNNVSFTADTKLPVGDEVIVKATILNYNGATPELTGSQVTYQLRDPAFAFADVVAGDEFEAGFSADMTVVPTSNEGEATFTLSSGNTDAVTIVDGKLHAVAEGDAEITASRAAMGESGEINYKAKNATFNVHVIAERTRYAITMDANGGSGDDPEYANQLAGATVNLPAANTYSKANSAFAGWVVNDGAVEITDGHFTMPAAAVTIKATWNDVETCTISFRVSGEEVATADAPQTAAYTITQTADDVNGYEFVGWAESEETEDVETVLTTISTYTPALNEDSKILYAVFRKSVEGGEVTDEITTASLPATGTEYTTFNDITISTSAIYTGKTSKSGGIQMNATSPNAIVTTTTGGLLKNISIEWNSGCTSGRILDVYAKNTAYTGSSDLWGAAAAQGTKVTSFTNGGSTTSYDFVADYAYIGVRSNDKALQIDKISITWETAITYYTTNPVAKYNIKYRAGDAENVTGLCDAERTWGTINLCDAPTCADKDFVKWSDGSSLYAAGAEYTLSADVTFTATWTPKPKYTVTYTANGGTGTAPEVEEYMEGETVTVKENEYFSKPGFVYAGWQVVYNDGTDHIITPNEDGEFEMVAYNVTIKALWEEPSIQKWVRVETTDDLMTDGTIYIIVGAESDVAMGSLNGSFYNSVGIVKTGNYLNGPESMTKITLENGSATGKFAIKHGSKYIHSGSAKSIGEQDAASDWTITIADGVATIKTGTGDGWYLKYNSKDPRFNTYASGQQTVAIYREKALKVIEDVNMTEEAVNTNDDVELAEDSKWTINNDKTVGDVHFKDGAIIANTAATVTTQDVYFKARHGKSNQIFDLSKIQVTGSLYYDFQLCDGDLDPNYWYSISVPFDVDLNDGVFQVGGTTPLVNHSDFEVWGYNTSKRAQTQSNGWERVTDNMMHAGKAYLIGFNPGQPNVIRLKAAADWKSHLFTGGTTMGVAESTGSGVHDNWNGLANPTGRYIDVDVDAQAFNNNTHGWDSYALDATRYNFVVGTAFFVQTSSAVTISNTDHGNYRAPQRAGNKFAYAVQITREGATEFDNQMVVRASEDATNAYEQGHDMLTMNNATSNTAALLWTENYGGKRLAIEEAPLVNNQAMYDLRIYAPAAGTYSLSAAAKEGADLYVTYEGAIVWNLSLGDYELDLTRGTTTGYGLLLVVQPNQMPTGVENGELLNGENGVQKILLNGQLYILRDGHLYDAVGKEMK